MDITDIFFPHAKAATARVVSQNLLFSHYTSASVLMEIIRKGEVWLRNSDVMNDFSEIRYGKMLLEEVFSADDIRDSLSSALGSIGPGEVDHFYRQTQKIDSARERESYLISLTEHDPDPFSEDRLGRLSMWRAYGGDASVCMVISSKPFLSVPEFNPLNAFASPVLYCDAKGLREKVLAVIKNVALGADDLRNTGRNFVAERLADALHFAVLSIKHPGFAEEREWRVIHSPTVYPSSELKPEIESPAGVPQKVYKLKLKDYSSFGLHGMALPELLKEVIVGPTQYPQTIRDAIVHQLQKAGIPDAHKKVRISDIPLRR